MADLEYDLNNKIICKSQNGIEPGVRKCKRFFLLECHTYRKCSMETSRNSLKLKFGIKVIKSAVTFVTKVLYCSVSSL